MDNKAFLWFMKILEEFWVIDLHLNNYLLTFEVNSEDFFFVL